jgi:2-polyprenyl-3-methyl-5-hydroxy-6-metoxy-1,4-benzoquinol methylase
VIRVFNIKNYILNKRKETTNCEVGQGTDQQKQFAKALSSFVGIDVTSEIKDPLKKMHVDFAMSTNDRGRYVAEIIENYIDIKNKRFLDVGCAYGGFLVAFAERGAADVVGIDINEGLLELARHNLSDNGIKANIMKADILEENLPEQIFTFDIVSCNDVIEHVDNPMQAIVNLSHLLKPNGILFMEIPNKYFSGFLREDGHYKLPGITLLPKSQADKYYRAIFDSDNTVGHYKSLSWYYYHLMRNGLQPKLVNNLKVSNISDLVFDFEESLRILKIFNDDRLDKSLNADIRQRTYELDLKFHQDLNNYHALENKNDKIINYAQQELMLRYGTSFWSIIAIKT